MSEWYEELFDERYVAFFNGLDRQVTAEADVDFLEDALDLHPGDAVLDLGCGQGRHAIPLAQRGYRVTGLDLSPVLLGRAERFAAERDVAVRWVRRRMEDLAGLGPFDACVCLYTVLGYYGDEGDLEVLRQVFGALRPGGALALDLTNFAAVLRRLPGEHWRETSKGVCCERDDYDPVGGWVVSERTRFPRSGGREELPVSRVRAYLPHETRGLLTRAGFETDLLFGGYDGQPFDWQRSAHQIHVARRPSQ